MKLDPQKAVILIPSLEPDDRLPAYVRKLLERGFTFHVDSPTNQLFPIFTDSQWEKIEELGFKLEFNGRLDEDHVVLRVCTSWCTPDEYVDKFIDAIQDL